MTLDEQFENYERHIVDNISELVDLRSLVYVYMAQSPGSTQTSIAQRLGVSQVMLSRMLSSPKQGIRDEMIPGVLALLKELDVLNFDSNWCQIKKVALEHGKYERNKVLVPIILDYINQYDEVPFEISSFDLSTNIFMCSRCDMAYKWCFVELDPTSNVPDVQIKLFRLERMLQSFLRDPKNHLTYVCFNEGTYLLFIEDRSLAVDRYGNHYESVMYADLDIGRVQEYLLNSPPEEPGC